VLVTAFSELLGQDSNLRPAGYKCPSISPGLGLSLHLLYQSRVKVSGANEALLGWAPQPLVSARSCLPSALQQASLRVTIPNLPGAGSPEFARCFNHSFLWKLQCCLQPAALPAELPRITGSVV